MINYFKQKLTELLIVIWVKYNFRKPKDIFSRWK